MHCLYSCFFTIARRKSTVGGSKRVKQLNIKDCLFKPPRLPTPIYSYVQTCAIFNIGRGTSHYLTLTLHGLKVWLNGNGVINHREELCSDFVPANHPGFPGNIPAFECSSRLRSCISQVSALKSGACISMNSYIASNMHGMGALAWRKAWLCKCVRRANAKRCYYYIINTCIAR